MEHKTSTASLAAKQAAGKAAAELIEHGMVVGLGSGSTSACFIEQLIKRNKEKPLDIVAVSTSQLSANQAAAGGIRVIKASEVDQIDLTADGADEIDAHNRMIKGGGGAHLREKIIASMSNRLIIMIDPSKEVEFLGKFPLPVEVLPFAPKALVLALQRQGFHGSWRLKADKSHYITDNHNYIFDIHLPHPCKNPEAIDQKLKRIPGILETGLFLNFPTEVIIGQSNGQAKIRN